MPWHIQRAWIEGLEKAGVLKGDDDGDVFDPLSSADAAALGITVR